MAIQREIWVQDIVENLFPANSFSNYAVQQDAFVLEGRVVHQPAAGLRPTVVKNRAVFPGPVSQRTDTELNYTLTEYSTDPVLLRNAEKYELSYDKRMSILGEHIASLRDAIHTDLLQGWLDNVQGLGQLPFENIVETSGDLVLGKRKVVLADLLKVKQKMDKANLPDEGRYLLFPPELYNELFSLPEIIQAETMGRATLPEGIVSQVLGFNVLKRGTTPLFNDGLDLKPQDEPLDPSDRLCIVAWSRYSVSRALGEVQLYESSDDPLYYGDVYSASVRAGGIRLRQEGVYAIVQAIS